MHPFKGILTQSHGILIAGQICIQNKSVMEQATTAAKLANIDIDDDTNRIDAKKMELETGSRGLVSLLMWPT